MRQTHADCAVDGQCISAVYNHTTAVLVGKDQTAFGSKVKISRSLPMGGQVSAVRHGAILGQINDTYAVMTAIAHIELPFTQTDRGGSVLGFEIGRKQGNTLQTAPFAIDQAVV